MKKHFRMIYMPFLNLDAIKQFQLRFHGNDKITLRHQIVFIEIKTIK